MTKSTLISRLLLFRHRALTASPKHIAAAPFLLPTHSAAPTTFLTRNYSTHFSKLSLNARVAAADRALQDLGYQAERERAREREERQKAGLDTADLDAENAEEEEEDYLGVGPLIEKLDKEKAKGDPRDLNKYEEPTDSDSDEDDETKSEAAVNKRMDQFEKKFKKHQELLESFAKAGL